MAYVAGPLSSSQEGRLLLGDSEWSRVTPGDLQLGKVLNPALHRLTIDILPAHHPGIIEYDRDKPLGPGGPGSPMPGNPGSPFEPGMPGNPGAPGWPGSPANRNN